MLFPRSVDQCGFGNEFPEDGFAPKSGEGGSQGDEGRGSCAATLAACAKSKVASDNDDEGETIRECGRKVLSDASGLCVFITGNTFHPLFRSA